MTWRTWRSFRPPRNGTARRWSASSKSTAARLVAASKTAGAAIEIARAIDAAPALKFSGIQAYHGTMQHLESYSGPQGQARRRHRAGEGDSRALHAVGLKPELVSGGGTGSYYFESNSGVYNELQCGSYAFMDADYGRIRDKDGNRIDHGEWENALFILTSVMSHAESRSGGLRRRAQGAVARQRPSRRPWPQRREIHQGLG